ncbi:transcriptional regulator, PadR family domain protein [Acidisarcina polymorpha]|uniref:Transcriptional regulator, PadR family domain protein n=1 Tax=Acidisarcina polymorpha TaxID=2211140 RepID=A0A2Z5FVE3_9BACT|nr:PadR family transcriptional regulator [Acidisarcina polymorpha]AXC10722.1 transcriptional regulator, PadR family domain protein [Acidisarcina polymorpha]
MGVLHRGDFHPYEIKRRLSQAMIECFTDVDVGTLYYAVAQLARSGLLAAVAHERVARGGMRTVYRITPRGRDRFRELLHAQFAAEGDLRQTLYGPMLFLHLADLDLVAAALRHQIDRQNARLAEIRKLRQQWEAMLPTGSRHLMQHMAEQCRLDLRWLRAVLADVEAGSIGDTPDPGRLAAK